MCLYSETNKPNIAQQDIVCYKCVIRHRRYFRPFHYTDKAKYKFGKLYKIDTNLFIDKVEKGRKWYNVNVGFHSYGDIMSYIKRDPNDDDCCYIKCIIPKGSLYFEETDSRGNVIYYCSEQLYIPNPPGNFFKRFLRKYICKYKSNLI
jgi:hypothetical protein